MGAGGAAGKGRTDEEEHLVLAVAQREGRAVAVALLPGPYTAVSGCQAPYTPIQKPHAKAMNKALTTGRWGGPDRGPAVVRRDHPDLDEEAPLGLGEDGGFIPRVPALFFMGNPYGTASPERAEWRGGSRLARPAAAARCCRCGRRRPRTRGRTPARAKFKTRILTKIHPKIWFWFSRETVGQELQHGGPRVATRNGRPRVGTMVANDGSQ